MNTKQTYFIAIIYLIISPLYATVKSNLTGTTYSRVQNQKTSIYKERTPWVSVFKSLRAEARTDIISLNFQYVVPLLDLNLSEKAANSSLTQSQAMMHLAAGSDVTITSTIRTSKSINYSPGHEISTFFTALFPTPGASGGHFTRYIGMFTANDGLAIGTQNSNFGVLHLQNGTATFISQENFNIDKLDGSGPSNFVLDITKLNIYYIAFGWLGAAPLEFGVASEDGAWIPFHRIRYPNLNITPTIFNPSLPLSMAVSKLNSGAGDLKIQTASWDATITGKEHAIRTNTTTNNKVTVDGETVLPYLSLRNRSTYAGNSSHTSRMRLLYLNVASDDTTNKLIRVQVSKNRTLNSTSWSNVDDLFSVAEVDTSATSYTSTGTLLFQTSINSAGEIWFKDKDIEINVYPGETLSIGAAEFGTGSAIVDFAVTWEEYL